MTLQIRRVVTGHDAQGRAVVKIDEVMSEKVRPRPGIEAATAWTTDGFPVDNDGQSDQAAREGVGTVLPNGTVFRAIEYLPGVTPRVHRTDSIDYMVILSGEVHMELEHGTEVLLKAGDLLVQRGTVHNWINRGTQPCIAAGVLIPAKPATIDGKPLPPVNHL